MELENKIRFLANFRYELKKNVTTDPVNYNVKILEKLIPDTDS